MLSLTNFLQEPANILANSISSQLKKLLAKSSKKLSFASLSLAQIKGGVYK
jgi:hypothetical protein